MISVGYLSLFLGCLVCAFGETQQQEEGGAPAPKGDSGRPLMAPGFLRYGNPYFVYLPSEERRFQSLPKNPTLTNEIDEEEPKKRPLFIFTTNDAPLSSHQLPPNSGPYIEIRKKRNVETQTPKPKTNVVELLRKKRSHCSKCGGGGYGGGGYGGGGGYYPVAYQAYPVYTSYQPVSYVPSYPSYGGGGGGCNTCGKGFGGRGGGGGGNSGSWSKSSSSAKSSSGSWGYGK